MYRLNWDLFKSMYRHGSSGYSTLERKSGIHQFFRTKEELLRAVTASLQPNEEILCGLEVYYGRPIMSLDKKASRILRGRRARGKFTELIMLGDDHGSVVISGEPIDIGLDEVEAYQIELDSKAADEVTTDGSTELGTNTLGTAVSGGTPDASEVSGKAYADTGAGRTN